MGNKCKNYQNNTTGHMLLYCRIRCSSMGKIITCLQAGTELNRACRSIAGCLNPTNVDEVYLPSGIGPPIRRDVCARIEKAKQETKEAHSLYWKIPLERRLKYRNCFLHSVKTANFPLKVIISSEWLRRTNKTPHRTSVNLDESLARGHDSPWTTWRGLNRLCAGYTGSKEQQKKWQYFD